MSSYVINFQNIDNTKLIEVGGKGANLGELMRIDGIHVPDGFCITTKAYQRILSDSPTIIQFLDELSLLNLSNRNKIIELSKKIRSLIEEIVMPAELKSEIEQYIFKFGENNAFAIRSSSTAEDLPVTSFAGQQDTYLNIKGMDEILKHISKCFASLFTERAVVYRIQNGFDHRRVYLSVIVQKMVNAEVAGIMFTADPVTSSRKVISIDASFGLGEAMVSGLVNTDNYKISNGETKYKKISTKKIAITASKKGGTKKVEIASEQQNRQVLTEEQILQLESIGRKIEAYFGLPQDIEWCLIDNTFYIVQSRPITTLFPIPVVNDKENHIFVSVGHQQMMTDPLKPLGMSIFKLTSFGPRFMAGGRLFVDVAQSLISPGSRRAVLDSLGQSDPLIKDALMTIIERGDVIKSLPDEEETKDSSKNKNDMTYLTETKIIDMEIVSDLIMQCQKDIKALNINIQSKSGTELFDFILEDINQLKSFMFQSQSMKIIMAAFDASAWINENMNHWLAEKNVADTLAQAVEGNITSEMGLELLNVADKIRPYKEVIDYLQQVKEDNFMECLNQFDGGEETKTAISTYLKKYGMRCVGEIDITRTRFSEKPTALIPLILSNIANFEPDESNRKLEDGRRKALHKEQELIDRLRRLPDGNRKVKETKEKIDQFRSLSGYREYPKYVIVNHYFIYKQALLKEAESLLKAGIIDNKADIYYLSFEEFREAVKSNKLDKQLINTRKDEHNYFEKLSPPRVITSDGEIITGRYNRDNLPMDALLGLPVSTGIIEGRARVILNIEDAKLESGDILVTTFTDPSWTPLFVSIKGLVTEVGGLMTHGAVIAREYGLPAVIGVENATRLIKDGQRIRLNGTDGYVELI